MEFLAEGFTKAFKLIISGDFQTFYIVKTSLQVSILSLIMAVIIGMPVSFLIAFNEFPGKKIIRSIGDSLLALPTVVVGLFVYAFITRNGPFGDFHLLFSMPGISIAQCVLILPIIISLSVSAFESLDERMHSTLYSLGARGRRIVISSIYEVRYLIIAAVITAYGRALSEVGISMMIGGNIKWQTRTITTAIALESGKGEFAMGIALGLILIIISLGINSLLSLLRRPSK
jgi:tungstate transport system permease protein